MKENSLPPNLIIVPFQFRNITLNIINAHRLINCKVQTYILIIQNLRLNKILCFTDVKHVLVYEPSDIKLSCGLKFYSIRFKLMIKLSNYVLFFLLISVGKLRNITWYFILISHSNIIEFMWIDYITLHMINHN